jgi:hypothetical protein
MQLPFDGSSPPDLIPYAGIGARLTPPRVCALMTAIAASLEHNGYLLRSGGAAGADEAFESGVVVEANKRIYLPWKGFNNNKSPLWIQRLTESQQLAIRKIAADFHPAWQNCTRTVRDLMSRNTLQVLGPPGPEDMIFNNRSLFVVCWTKDGKDSGGTGQALRIARHYGQQVFNLQVPADRSRLMSQFDWDGTFKSAIGLAYE